MCLALTQTSTSEKAETVVSENTSSCNTHMLGKRKVGTFCRSGEIHTFSLSAHQDSLSLRKAFPCHTCCDRTILIHFGTLDDNDKRVLFISWNQLSCDWEHAAKKAVSGSTLQCGVLGKRYRSAAASCLPVNHLLLRGQRDWGGFGEKAQVSHHTPFHWLHLARTKHISVTLDIFSSPVF